MPDKRAHRGPHPEDIELFGPSNLSALRSATADLCWLLDRHYSAVSALKLVGDRYQLKQRQRVAVMRCSCPAWAAQDRERRRWKAAAVRSKSLWLDGYNVLTTLEAALGGGVLLIGRDRCVRDMCSMHGTYRKVSETIPAVEMLGRCCSELGISGCHWFLDQPVSNSGRLKSVLLEIAKSHGWNWEVELVPDPDKVLGECDEIVATADSVILGRCQRWFALTGHVIQELVPGAWRVDLWTDSRAESEPD